MRKLVTYFIKHSVAVNIVVIAFLIFGFAGAYNLKSSYFPLVDSKNININITRIHSFKSILIRICQ